MHRVLTEPPGAPPVEFADLAAALPTGPDGAAVLLAIHADASTAIVLRRGPDGRALTPGPADVIPLPGLSRPWLRERLWAWSREPSPGRWGARLDALLKELGERLVAPLLPRLRALGTRRLLLVPHRELHLLPLHAAWGYAAGGGRAHPLDALAVAYAPSLSVLARTAPRPVPASPAILSVAPADSGLPFAASDLAGIAPALARVVPLDPATPRALRRAVPDPAFAILHAACHGTYALGDPLRSALALAGGALTLADLYGAGTDGEGSPARVRLAQSLATLSACEAAVSDAASPSDECHGLPAGMLFAGATAVVAPLWAVDDLATAILMRRFYAALLSPDEVGARPSVAEALGRARLALREATAGELLAEGWLGEDRLAAMGHEAHRRHYRSVRQGWERRDPRDRPFQAPRHWAAWCAIGSAL